MTAPSGPDIHWNTSDSTPSRLLDPGGRQRVFAALSQLFADYRSIVVLPLAQGRSRAVLVRVQTIARDGTPEVERVVKIAPVRDLERERRNHEAHVIGKITDYPQLAPVYLPVGGDGAIAYTFIGADGATTFAHLFETAIASGDAERPHAVLVGLFERTMAAWGNSSVLNHVELTGPDTGYPISASLAEKFEIQGAIVNDHLPIAYRSDPSAITASWRALQHALQPRLTRVAIAHGDLHGENILVDDRNRSYLIDFAHTGPRHFLYDIARLEADLRFRRIPPLSDRLEDALRVWDEVDERFLFPIQITSPATWQDAAPTLTAGLACVQALRAHAFKLASTLPAYEDEYLLALLRNALPMLLYEDVTMEHRARILRTATRLAQELNARQVEPVRRRASAIISSGSMDGSAPEDRARHLPAPSYARLFGVDKLLDDLVGSTSAEGAPHVISLEGLGGLGKTAIAAAIARRVARDSRFRTIAWESFRQDEVDFRRAVDEPRRVPQIDAIIASLSLQLGFGREPLDERISRIKHFTQLLAEDSVLVVVDNLETPDDVVTVASLLASGPRLGRSKLLVTSRHGVASAPFRRPLDELLPDAAIDLLRYEAEWRGINSVAEAADRELERILEVVGGNPLVLKLVVGQLRHLPLGVVLRRLQAGVDVTAETLYRFIYWESWRLLSEDARDVLTLMPHFPHSGADWPGLSAVVGWGTDRLARAVEALSDMSLLVVSGTIDIRRYSIHRLTHTFLATEIIDWMPTNDGAADPST